jgi:hypothetical protein
MNDRYATSAAAGDSKRLREVAVGLAVWLFTPWAQAHGGHGLHGAHAHAWEGGAWVLAAAVAAGLVVWLSRRR